MRLAYSISLVVGGGSTANAVTLPEASEADGVVFFIREAKKESGSSSSLASTIASREGIDLTGSGSGLREDFALIWGKVVWQATKHGKWTVIKEDGQVNKWLPCSLIEGKDVEPRPFRKKMKMNMKTKKNRSLS